ncbi:hypothetical protein MLD38_039475 [Melastoma candidum]|nr:hypothetical protein MLD38_039475 [Melastoma candidum]
MKSIAGSIFCCGFAGASYLSSLLISIVHHITGKDGHRNWLPEDLNKGRLDYFYYLVAAIGVLNLGYFLMCSSCYRYKGDSDAETEFQKENPPEKVVV